MRASLLILAVLALVACASSSTYPLSPVEIQHLKESQAKRVYYIGGGVKHPGAYRIPSGKNITLSQALAKADGALDSARLDSVRVFRSVDGAWVVIKKNATTGASEGNFAIRPGDSIYVAESTL